MTTTHDRIPHALAAIDRQIESAQRRQDQTRARFDKQLAAAGFLAALETVSASTLEEAAEDAIWLELRDALGDETDPTQRYDIVVKIHRRLARAARNRVSASSSCFMSNALAIARHNALLSVVDVLDQCEALVRAGER